MILLSSIDDFFIVYTIQHSQTFKKT